MFSDFFLKADLVQARNCLQILEGVTTEQALTILRATWLGAHGWASDLKDISDAVQSSRGTLLLTAIEEFCSMHTSTRVAITGDDQAHLKGDPTRDQQWQRVQGKLQEHTSEQSEG